MGLSYIFDFAGKAGPYPQDVFVFDAVADEDAGKLLSASVQSFVTATAVVAHSGSAEASEINGTDDLAVGAGFFEALPGVSMSEKSDLSTVIHLLTQGGPLSHGAASGWAGIYDTGLLYDMAFDFSLDHSDFTDTASLIDLPVATGALVSDPVISVPEQSQWQAEHSDVITVMSLRFHHGDHWF